VDVNGGVPRWSDYAPGDAGMSPPGARRLYVSRAGMTGPAVEAAAKAWTDARRAADPRDTTLHQALTTLALEARRSGIDIIPVLLVLNTLDASNAHEMLGRNWKNVRAIAGATIIRAYYARDRAD
jgi:hypothetical protein